MGRIMNLYPGAALMRLFVVYVLFLATFLICCGESATAADPQTKSFYSPIIYVDKEKGYIVISNSGAVFGIEASPAAKPHLEKLPISGLIDVVVEIRPDAAPMIRSWKVASGETSCRIFDGKECH